MDAVDQALASLGIGEIRLGVVPGNAGALRFYERRGMRPFTHVLLGRVARGPDR